MARAIHAKALTYSQSKVCNWLAGEDITIADIACAGYLFYTEDFTFDRADYPQIDRWLDRIAARPGWKHPYDLMPRGLTDAA
jgi:glutathione S-transferase